MNEDRDTLFATYYYLLFLFHCSENSSVNTTAKYYKKFLTKADIGPGKETDIADKYNLTY